MRFGRGYSAAEKGLKKVIDMGDDTALTLTRNHTNTIFLVGEAVLAVTLPAAATIPNGWTVKFIGHHATSATLTNTVTCTCAGTNELFGHCVTGGDNGNRQLQPVSAGAKDNIKLHTIAAKGDWFEITRCGAGYFVFGRSRITNGLPMA